MSAQSTCYLCRSLSTGSQPRQVTICGSCKEEHPYLTAGIQADFSSKQVRYASEILGQGIGWYSVIGVQPYIDEGNLYELEDKNQNPQDPESLLDELESAIKEFGGERTISYLVAHSQLNEQVRFFEDNSRDEAGLPPQMFRFAFGFLLSLNLDFNTDPLEKPIDNHVYRFPSEYINIVQILRQVIATFGNDEYLKTVAGVDPETEAEELVRVARAVQNRELILSRTAYYGQYLQAMERQYTPFQREFFNRYNIDITACVQWSYEITEELEKRHQRLWEALTEYRNAVLRVIGGYIRSVESDEIESPEEYVSTNEYTNLHRREIANWNIVLQTIRDQFWVTPSEIRSFTEDSNSEYFDRYLDIMSTEIGEATLSSPYDHNKMDEAPIIKMGSDYLLPQLSRFGYSLSQRFYYLLASEEKNLHRDLGNTWGDVIELWAANRIAKIVDNNQFTHSVDYETASGENGEIDILVRIDDRVLVGEVKAKRLPAKARKGSLKEIKDATASSEKGVGKAVDQLNSSVEALKNINNGTEIGDDVPFSLDPKEITDYTSMVITATHYDQIATRQFPALFEDYNVEDLPYLCSVYSLDSMAEVLDGVELMEYVCVRQNELRKRRAFAAGDELDFLEAFKAGQLQESVYPLPSIEESEKYNMEITRNIYNIDAGVHEIVGNKYGLSSHLPYSQY